MDTSIQWEFYLTLYKVDTFIRRTPLFSPSVTWLSISWTPLSDGHLLSILVLFDSRWDGHLYKRDTVIQWEFYLTLYKVDTFIRRTPPFNPSFIWLSLRWTPLSDGHLHSVRVLFDPRWDRHLYKRDTYFLWEFYLTLYKVDTLGKTTLPFTLDSLYISVRRTPHSVSF